MITPELQRDVEQFLYKEARLLDQQRFDEWLALFTDDVRYWAPTRDILPEGTPEDDDGLSFPYLDDNIIALRGRVRRLGTGMAHVETPPSLTRHLVSNVIIEEPGATGELAVQSNFALFVCRKERDTAWFVGERLDRLRNENGAWKIAERKILLDHPVIPRTVSVFF